MVNSTIPTHYTGSPSSLSTTPFLTINHDATEALDSTNAFEGPEKLLEVWFSPSALGLPAGTRPNGLKSVSQEVWRGMLDLVNCQVLSTIESDHVDAYLLSESSMFVFPHKLVLKTCGTTTLLLGLPRMLEIAAAEAGFPTEPKKPTMARPHRVFYSRKNYLFPDKQQGPHRSWRDEVHYLDRTFPGGSAYMIGKMNGEHWYLYITAPMLELTPPQTPTEKKIERAITSNDDLAALDPLQRLKIDIAGDETLEILMTDLDEENAKQFYQEQAVRISQEDPQRQAHASRKDGVDQMHAIPEDHTINHRSPLLNGISDATFDVFEKNTIELPEGSAQAALAEGDDANITLSEGHMLGQAVSSHCGLADVYPVTKYPDAKIDAFMFTPCGFSANGVIPNPADAGMTHYFTVHVTPEPVCSYASFETNVPAHQTGRETADVVAQVVDIFKPGRFSVTLFEAKNEEDGETKLKKVHRMDDIPGYRRVDRVLHDLEGYELVFRHFEKEGFKGGAPRISG